MCTEWKAQTINLPASRSACFVGSSHTKLHTHSRPNDPMHCPVQHLGNQRHLPGPRRWDVTLPAVSTAETATILPVHCWYNHPEMETEKNVTKQIVCSISLLVKSMLDARKKLPTTFPKIFGSWVSREIDGHQYEQRTPLHSRMMPFQLKSVTLLPFAKSPSKWR